MKRLALIAALCLAGCKKPPPPSAPDQAWLDGTPRATTATPKDGGALIIRLALEPTGLTRLHDRFAEGTMTRITVGPLYETLGGRLATNVVRSDDHLTTTLTLRDGVTFHDGTPFTSADVKATLDVILDAKNATSVLRTSLETLADVETPDAKTVVLTWRRPYVFAEETVLNAVPMLPAHALKGAWDTLPLHRAPIGTGPFRFEKWDPGVSITYVKADARAHVDRVVFRVVKDEVAAQQAFERGEFDVMTKIAPASWKAMEKQPWAWERYQRVRFAENAYAWIGFNQRKAMFSDVATRRALAMLYPADLVSKTVTLELEPRTTCPYFPASKSCDDAVKALPFDVTRAKAELKQAGWLEKDGVLQRAGEKFSFAFLAPAQSVRMAKVLPLYVDVLKTVGIDARIETVDVSAYMSRVRPHDFDAIALSWASPSAVQDNFQNFHSSQVDEGSNFVGYRSEAVDALLEEIRVTYDDAAREALERRVHRLVYNEQAYLFLTRTTALDAFKRDVQNVKPSLRWYDLSELWRSP